MNNVWHWRILTFPYLFKKPNVFDINIPILRKIWKIGYLYNLVDEHFSRGHLKIFIKIESIAELSYWNLVNEVHLLWKQCVGVNGLTRRWAELVWGTSMRELSDNIRWIQSELIRQLNCIIRVSCCWQMVASLKNTGIVVTALQFLSLKLVPLGSVFRELIKHSTWQHVCLPRNLRVMSWESPYVPNCFVAFSTIIPQSRSKNKLL